MNMGTARFVTPAHAAAASDVVRPEFDAVVVGAGQAGLAMAWHLKRRGLRFVLMEAGPRVGDVWRSRWDSLTLFTPTQYDALPGVTFPGEAGRYPGKDEVADYLLDYANRFAFAIRLNTRVERLSRSGGVFELHTNDEVLTARQVVLATGPFQQPFVPPVAAGLDSAVVQLHSAQYRNPAQLPDGPVLVVGAGNSGWQIARELSASRRVDLAVGSSPTALPQRWLGKDLFWWGTRLHLIDRPVETRLGRRLQASGETIIGDSRRSLQRAGVRFRTRLVGADGRTARFADGTTVDASAWIWATGYRSDYRWVDVDGVLSDDGRVLHRRGVTAVPGLYFLGMPWQHSRGSALLGFVQQDAAYLAEILARRAASLAATAAGPHAPIPEQGV
jgi:putative flavoprotein involved in K+ transport